MSIMDRLKDWFNISIAFLPFPLNLIAVIVFIILGIIVIWAVAFIYLQEIVFGLALYFITYLYLKNNPELGERYPYIPILGFIMGLILGNYVKRFEVITLSSFLPTTLPLSYMIAFLLIIVLIYGVYRNLSQRSIITI